MNSENNILTSGVFFIDSNNKITIQSAKYIEDGWYVEIVENKITLFEIPYGGGGTIEIGKFMTISEAINAGLRLS